ncbi:hypothetical protein BDU57DRAFT_438520 [Ampelomyces quisqualis]|uniref:Uncharacterized protein n=1 Tax=Ampelomyces quisqualis TaxID=50730 RepID=A0A6A5QZD5_AMPQU|nr:hypothetical protein BDU57DRAFT_438520 [Ampelomyces quisqualis]
MSTSAPAPKRASTGKTTAVEIIEDEPNESCHVTAKLHSKFVIFPEDLRHRLQRMYQSLLQFQMAALLSGTTHRFNYTYSIVTEEKVREKIPHAGSNITLCRENIVSLSIANTTLLEIFLEVQKDALAEPKFILLKTQKGLANPDFNQLHSVRHDEIGWGFDTNGCLSLYLVSIDKGRLKEYFIYVQRAGIKTEEQA